MKRLGGIKRKKNRHGQCLLRSAALIALESRSEFVVTLLAEIKGTYLKIVLKTWSLFSGPRNASNSLNLNITLWKKNFLGNFFGGRSSCNLIFAWNIVNAWLCGPHRIYLLCLYVNWGGKKEKCSIFIQLHNLLPCSCATSNFLRSIYFSLSLVSFDCLLFCLNWIMPYAMQDRSIVRWKNKKCACVIRRKGSCS